MCHAGRRGNGLCGTKRGFMRSGICIVLTSLAIGALLGCENPTNSAANNIPLADSKGATGNDDTVGLSDSSTSDSLDATLSDGSTATTACDCMKAGDMYRFTTLQLTSIDGNPDFPVVPVLNSLWQSDIDTFELNFIVKITKVTSDYVDVEVTNGARVGDTKKPCMLAPTRAPLHFPRKGCQFLESDPGSMNVYAGSQEHTKNCGYLAQSKLGVDHSIPIRGAILKAIGKEDCSGIIGGEVIAGSFSKDALFKLCTCQTTPGQNSDVCTAPDPKYKDTVSDPPGACNGCGDGWQSLGGLLSAFAGDKGLQYGCKSDAGGPSVCLTATFEAEKIDLSKWTPVDCPAK